MFYRKNWLILGTGTEEKYFNTRKCKFLQLETCCKQHRRENTGEKMLRCVNLSLDDYKPLK